MSKLQFETERERQAAEQEDASALRRHARRAVWKRRTQKRHAAKRKARAGAQSAQTAQAAARRAKNQAGVRYSALRRLASDRRLWAAALALLLVAAILFSLVSSCAVLAQGGMQLILESSYTAEDEDILAVEATYCAMEQALAERMADITSEYPGYDEYTVSMAEIGHDPFALASYLTALYYDYTPEEVAAELERLFSLQYVMTTEVRTETRTRTTQDGSTESYTVRILDISLTNTAIATLAMEELDAEQFEHFCVLQETKGNKAYLFESYTESIGGGTETEDYTDYEIPPEALEDAEFAALIAEAEKYLGWPYVWGGSSPATSFDCSGFVCYVLRASGVWNISRTTAQGIYNQCTRVSESEAKPGDLIFFQGTYSTSDTVTHIGIYVGNGMMIHAGNPIQYASIQTSYWQQHFYAFGRY